MKVDELKNLSQNENLKNRIVKILNLESVEKQYRSAQVILEYVNAYFLTQDMKINMDNDFDILRIIDEYKKIDEDLYNTMLEINDLYEELDETGADEFEVEYILRKTDFIYGIMKDICKK